MENAPSSKDEPEAVLNGKKTRRLSPAVLVIGAFYLILMIVLFTGGESMPEVFPAPDFTLANIMGPGEVTLSANKGHPVIIYFFASW
ncbi:hypothetical protein LCGC14_1505240 [marine sediment metagenome]|uniref:Alkyl hydroperoxide reductase subunit C/ Thiol specific antioxidant domain-containing protein n=1 Tax=marine sediment metagenome TaxID=412755 RepID=A0A0F9J3C2_9ZZZZ